MAEAHGIYQIDTDAVTRTVGERSEGEGGLVLVHALRGFIDAGAAGQLVSEHLATALSATRLATFDVDDLLDYRSRRPVMTFDTDRWADYAEPYLALDHVVDADGDGFLLLHGLEPDRRWERTAAAVRELVQSLGVSLTVGVHGIPMGVPHTRPASLTAHATRPGLVEDYTSYFGRVEVPGSFGALLEYRLGEAGHDAMGLTVHVPHYLAQSRFVPAAVTALRHLEKATGLALTADRLSRAADETHAEVAELVAANDEVASVVRQLEEQYDAFARSVGRTSLLAQDAPLPTAEELGAQFEQFLAQRDDDPTG